ncbi:MAG TPA: tetratricopeptide repeat protein [Chryseolinea sp.]|nr:tetratricopeptide repeat protein [Chryseolinea sp.]
MNPLPKIPFPLLAFLISFNISAESVDSLVRWNEIHFEGAFEQTSFTNFLKNSNKDYLKLFLANSPSAENDFKLFEEKISRTLEEINSSGALKKKNDKKVKYIYQVVHEKFLSKYEAENRFHEIIKTGNYNCVTATALFALFFEKLNIPYAIKEEPTHVYLVAYPNAENVLIETTTPMSGFLTFDDAFKTSYVDLLKKQKIIGSNEATPSNVDALFNKYYFGKENISLTQLIGIHFLNDALFKRDHDDIDGAYEQVKKGYLYYPNTRSEYLLMSFTALKLESVSDPLKKASLIGQVSRFKNAGITSEMIQGEFNNLTQTVLLKKNDKDLYLKCYKETVRNITDPELIKEIDYIFYYENGRVFYNQGNYVRAKPYFAKALQTQPNNVDLGGIFVSCLAQSLRNERNNVTILDSLELYKTRFPALLENNNFNALIAYAYVVEFGDSFEKGNVTRGEKYQLLFENLYASDKTLLNPDAVGNAYSEASIYYFKKGQKAKAKQILEKGLEIVPDNYQLKARKQMINGG